MREDSVAIMALLADYLSGEASPEERLRVEHWIGDNPERQALVAQLRAAWQPAERSIQLPDADSVKKALRARIAASSTSTGNELSPHKLREHSKFPAWLAYAAMSCVILAVVFGIRQFASVSPSTEIQQYSTYSTAAGQRASLTLGDGLRVTLGPATVLRVVKPSSGKGVSRVDVSGEAFFAVEHAATRSFTVGAHGVTTRVLGTEFVVRAYDPSLVHVAVRDGRVSVQSQALTASNAAVVVAGEAASVTPNKPPAVSHIADLATEFSWASGELVLNDVPLGEAAVRLSRWYGVDVRIADQSLLENRINWVFPSGFSITRMQNLAKAIGARAVMTSDGVTFLSKP